jgi:hypothetical protein
MESSMGDGKFSTLLRDVAGARKHHDKTCPYRGTAIEVHLNPADADRLGVEEGEDLAGLTAVRDAKQSPSLLRVYCDAELHGQGEPISTQSAMSLTTPNTEPIKVGSL